MKLELTLAEVKVFSVLLEHAGDQMSNNGCNDFSLIRDGVNASGRRSGRTTRQLQALPIGGWYFCHVPNYTKLLSQAVNRTDIQFHNMSALFDPMRFSGYVIPGIDIDHYCWELYSPTAITTCLKTLEPCVLRARMNFPLAQKSTTTKSTICLCGIDRRDCDYHK